MTGWPKAAFLGSAEGPSRYGPDLGRAETCVISSTVPHTTIPPSNGAPYQGPWGVSCMKFLAWFLIALLAAAPMALAGDHDEEEDDSEHENGDDDQEWEYQLSVSGGRASIEMERESGEDERSIEFEYKRDDAAIEFSLESETGDIEQESSMEVQFHQLLEYEDDNGNGRFDDGETIVQAFTLADDSEDELVDGVRVSWGPISQSAVTSDNGVSGTKFSSTAGLNGGSIRFDFYVFADEATLGPASLEATELKMDIAIMNFPFQSNDSALALYLESESEVEIEDDADVEGDEEGVIANAGDAQLLFAWKDFATVDGRTESVETTRLSSETSQEDGEYENEELLVFSYARGDDILHDPTMGVSTAGAGSQGIPGPGIVLLVAGLALAVARRRF